MSEYTLDFIERNPIAIQHEIKELEAEVERLQSKVDDYEYPLRTTRKITVLQEVWDEREKRRKELEAELERLEAQLKIAARDYAAVCDYPLAPSEALESWEYEALKEAGNE